MDKIRYKSVSWFCFVFIAENPEKVGYLFNYFISFASFLIYKKEIIRGVSFCMNGYNPARKKSLFLFPCISE